MKSRMALWMLLAMAVTAMAGCSSLHRKGDPSAWQPAARGGVDQAFVAKVNAQAAQNGTQVLWNQPPQASVSNGH
ncbi:MAG: hypothetical protein JSR26_05695 [Proteobacteria bacterium]|nr:hypothetical protein [Pseudomonadota bacterium]